MAAEINGYPVGTVSHLYITSDGGMQLGDVFDMVHLLDAHVKIVGTERVPGDSPSEKNTSQDVRLSQFVFPTS